jgi:hypothetical protein
MGRYQEGHLVKRFGGWHVRYYVTENGTRKQKSHRLCADQQKKSHVKQLWDEFLRTQVNIGAQNSGPMRVVEFWDRVYLPFIESSNLKPSTIHGYKQVWNQHLKSHFNTTNPERLQDARHVKFPHGFGKDSQAAHVEQHQMACQCDLCSCRCYRQL